MAVEWVMCVKELEEGEPCSGAAVHRGLCLGHLAGDDLTAYLKTVKNAGHEGVLDGRGARISAEHLKEILKPFRGTEGVAQLSKVAFQRSVFGDGASFGETNFGDGASFDDATFVARAWFGEAKFGAGASFRRATFVARAWFGEAKFGAGAYFTGSTFEDVAWFDGADFGNQAVFDGSTFGDGACFAGTTFGDKASFADATFGDGACLAGTTFGDKASFADATFGNRAWFGRITSNGAISIANLRLSEPARFEVAAEEIDAQRLRLPDGGILRFSRALVDLTEAAFVRPTIIGPGSPPSKPEQSLPQTEPDLRPSIVSLERADVGCLVLTDVKLEDCRFAGAHNLDCIRLEGDVTFRPARGWIKSLKRTRRQVLYEESEWADRRSRIPSPRPKRRNPEPTRTPEKQEPLKIEALYRALRKSMEDSKDEPGAADFYYGEMEMRRLAARRVSGERAILFVYKALSGYGMRASRSLAALALVLTAAAFLFHHDGFVDPASPFLNEQDAPTETQMADGPQVPAANVAPPPKSFLPSFDAWVYSLGSAINVFGSSSVQLTTLGRFYQVVLRLLGPLLLGLAILAFRGRVKR